MSDKLLREASAVINYPTVEETDSMLRELGNKQGTDQHLVDALLDYRSALIASQTGPPCGN